MTALHLVPKQTDPRFLDPTGWRPTELQRSVPPGATGVLIDQWCRKQRLVSQAEMEQWRAARQSVDNSSKFVSRKSWKG